VNVFTILSLLFLIVVNVLMMLGISVSNVASFMYALIRVYNMLFCLLSIAIQFEVKTIVKHVDFFDSWPGRGMLYIFLGVLTLGGGASFTESFVPLVQLIAGWLLIGFGALYFLMGIFGLKSKKEGIQKEVENKA